MMTNPKHEDLLCPDPLKLDDDYDDNDDVGNDDDDNNNNEDNANYDDDPIQLQMMLQPCICQPLNRW